MPATAPPPPSTPPASAPAVDPVEALALRVFNIRVRVRVRSLADSVGSVVDKWDKKQRRWAAEEKGSATSGRTRSATRRPSRPTARSALKLPCSETPPYSTKRRWSCPSQSSRRRRRPLTQQGGQRPKRGLAIRQATAVQRQPAPPGQPSGRSSGSACKPASLLPPGVICTRDVPPSQARPLPKIARMSAPSRVLDSSGADSSKDPNRRPNSSSSRPRNFRPFKLDPRVAVQVANRVFELSDSGSDDNDVEYTGSASGPSRAPTRQGTPVRRRFGFESASPRRLSLTTVFLDPRQAG